MTLEERERERLHYIQESILRINQYTHGGREAFFSEPIVQDAVLRRVETLADATGKLSSALTSRHPQIRWRQIYGFRNIAAHAYEHLDLRRVWEIVERYLPELRMAIDAELADPGADP